MSEKSYEAWDEVWKEIMPIGEYLTTEDFQFLKDVVAQLQDGDKGRWSAPQVQRLALLIKLLRVAANFK